MKQEEKVWAPPILFNETDRSHSNSRKNKDDDEVEDKTRCVIFKVPFDPKSAAEKKDASERKVLVFKKGTPRGHVDFQRATKALVRQLGRTAETEEVSVTRALPEGRSLQTFKESTKC